jgi:hypothetical protein
MSLFMVATAAMMRCLLKILEDHLAGVVRGLWINSETCAEQSLHSCYRVGLPKLQDTKRLLLWSHHFATRSPLAAAAARNTFPRQLHTNFESFPNNCCVSRDCRLTGSFIISIWKCCILLEMPCIRQIPINWTDRLDLRKQMERHRI